jgi:hypothetical protein
LLDHHFVLSVILKNALIHRYSVGLDKLYCCMAFSELGFHPEFTTGSLLGHGWLKLDIFCQAESLKEAEVGF